MLRLPSCLTMRLSCLKPEKGVTPNGVYMMRLNQGFMKGYGFMDLPIEDTDCFKNFLGSIS